MFREDAGTGWILKTVSSPTPAASSNATQSNRIPAPPGIRFGVDERQHAQVRLCPVIGPPNLGRHRLQANLTRQFPQPQRRLGGTSLQHVLDARDVFLKSRERRRFQDSLPALAKDLEFRAKFVDFPFTRNQGLRQSFTAPPVPHELDEVPQAPILLLELGLLQLQCFGGRGCSLRDSFFDALKDMASPLPARTGAPSSHGTGRRASSPSPWLKASAAGRRQANAAVLLQLLRGVPEGIVRDCRRATGPGGARGLEAQWQPSVRFRGHAGIGACTKRGTCRE